MAGITKVGFDCAKSRKLMEQSLEIVPGGVNSPVRAFKSVGGTPRFIAKGAGAFLYDVDGNKYLDFCNSWGPLILGHADKDVVAAVKAQVDKGMTFGASTELEYELAQFIVQNVDVVLQADEVDERPEAIPLPHAVIRRLRDGIHHEQGEQDERRRNEQHGGQCAPNVHASRWPAGWVL